MSHSPRPMVIDNEGRRETNHAHAAFDILTRAYADDHEDIYVPMGGTVTPPHESLYSAHSLPTTLGTHSLCPLSVAR